MREHNGCNDQSVNPPKVIVCFAVKTADAVEKNEMAGWHVQVEVRAREQTTDSVLKAFERAGNAALKEIGDLTFQAWSECPSGKGHLFGERICIMRVLNTDG